MLEAVNSVLQTAPVLRGNAEQTSTVDSFAGNPERVQKIAQAPYVSPYIHVDVNFDKAVLQLRDSETGDVENQFPSQPQLEAQARAAARRQIENEAQLAKAAPRPNVKSAQAASAPKQDTAPPPASTGAGNISPQQKAAFDAAARSGNSNAGNITLFA